MGAFYNHTNIISPDPERLGRFYEEVFGCVRHGPERDLSGAWLERGTGLPGARLRGIFLRLPGHGDTGPSLEILRVEGVTKTLPGAVDRPGLMHLCFNVDDAYATLDAVLEHGGSALGEIVQAARVEGLGVPDFVYCRDPDGNILELLAWTPDP